MNFWDTVAGYNFADKLLDVLKDIAKELKEANELKRKELGIQEDKDEIS